MEKRKIALFYVIFIILMSLSFASAFWPFDWFKQITGNAVLNQEQIDSLKSDLVGWYRFDMDGSVGESSGLVHDWSGNGNDGTAVGGATYNSGGKFDGAYQFDGSGSVVTKNDFSDSNGVTISAWANLAKPASSNPLVSKSGEWVLYLSSNRTIIFTIYNLSSNQRTNVQHSVPVSNSLYDAWHHFAVAFNGNCGTIYIDGNDMTGCISTGFGGLYDSSYSVVIGKYGSSIYSKGLIDEVTIFDRSLSSDEISFLYNDYVDFIGNYSPSEPLPSPVLNCTDSDGGLSPYVLGNVSFNSTKSADVCLNSTSLKEYYCDLDNIVKYNIYSCSGGCSFGVCGNSTLVPDTNQTLNQTQTENQTSTFSSVDKCSSLFSSVKSKVKSLSDLGKTLIFEEGVSGKVGEYFIIRPENGGKILQLSFVETQVPIRVKLTDASLLINKYESIPNSEGKGNFSIQGTIIYYHYSGGLTSVSSNSSVVLTWGTGSAPGDVGVQKDTFNCNFSVSASTNATVSVINVTSNITGEENVVDSSSGSENDCTGCFVVPDLGGDNEECIPFGVRAIIKGEKDYCEIDGNMYSQKALNQTCLNNFECLSNQCVEDKCVEILGELQSQAGVLKKIWCWITNIVDDEGYLNCLNE